MDGPTFVNATEKEKDDNVSCHVSPTRMSESSTNNNPSSVLEFQYI